MYFIFRLWHNYWEFSRLCPRHPKSFQNQSFICICFYGSWCLSLDGILFGYTAIEVGLWRFPSPGSSQATGQGKMIAWRLSSLVMQARPSIFQACSSLILFSCAQLPHNPLVSLGTISLSQATSYEAAGQQGLRYIHLQPGVFHWSPVSCTSMTMKWGELKFHLGNHLTFKHRKGWDIRTIN